MVPSRYLRPTSLTETLAALGERPWAVLAGGTDFYPARVGRPVTEDVLDITAVAELRGIEGREEGWHIGATTTWADLLAAPLPPLFDALKQAAREVGGLQIQNAGTICGNVCNASPAADGVPALLALGAQVELCSPGTVTVVPLEAFILGPRRTRRQAHELVSGLVVPKPAHRAVSAFSKLGARKYLVISIAMAAACVETNGAGQVLAARVAVGACSPVAIRLPALEQALAAAAPGTDWGALVKADHLAPLTPIADVRGSAEYRRDAALTVVARVLRSLQASA